MFFPRVFALGVLLAMATGLVVALVLLVRGRWVKALCVFLGALLLMAFVGVSGLWFAGQQAVQHTYAYSNLRSVPTPPPLPRAAPAMATPDGAEGGNVCIDIHSGAPVISFAIPAECKRGVESARLELRRDIWESLAEFSSGVRATDREVETLQRRLRNTNLWELAERLLRNLEERGVIRIESDGREASADDGRRVPSTHAQASFHANEIRVLLDEMRAAVPRRAAKSRPVVLSTLGVVAILLIAYWLLRGSLRHATATGSHAPRHRR